MLVVREKPSFQALSKRFIVLLCAEVVRQEVSDHEALHGECLAADSGYPMSWHHYYLLCGRPETLPANNIGDRCATVDKVLQTAVWSLAMPLCICIHLTVSASIWSHPFKSQHP